MNRLTAHPGSGICHASGLFLAYCRTLWCNHRRPRGVKLCTSARALLGFWIRARYLARNPFAGDSHQVTDASVADRSLSRFRPSAPAVPLDPVSGYDCDRSCNHLAVTTRSSHGQIETRLARLARARNTRHLRRPALLRSGMAGCRDSAECRNYFSSMPACMDIW